MSDHDDQHDDLCARVDEALPGVLADLADLVAIESVSSDPDRVGEVTRSAEAIARLFGDLGGEARVVRDGDGGPAVIARFPGPEGTPTVCLYAHHDVQPEGDPAEWTSPPFTATKRGDRLYGRGAGDDKGGVALHLAALRAFDGKPPVGVTLFVEGEEEVGSSSLPALLATHHDALAADVFIIADSGNWTVGTPAFTTTLRGLAEANVEVRTLDHPLHSGQFGGAVPDALMVLVRLLASLHDDAGNVAVGQLSAGPGPDLDYPADRLAAETGVLPGVSYIGEGPVVERIWTKPAISVLAIDAPRIAQAGNILVPAARAKISLRVAPGDDAGRAQQMLVEHLETSAPWGAKVTVTPGERGQPSTIPFEGPHAEAAQRAFTTAWGVEPVLTGQGGSIPMVADFAGAFPASTVLVTAVCDPDSRMHGIDESLHLGDFTKACRAEALFLQALAAVG